MTNPIIDAAIRAALADREKHDAKSPEFQTRAARLQGIIAEGDRAAAELDAITSKDAAALSEWSSGGCVGDPPQPDTRGREVAQKKLFAASARADAARAAMRTLEAESVAHAEARGPFNVGVQMATASYLVALHEAQQAELRQLDDRRAVLTAVSAATWNEAQRRHAGIAGRAAEDADAARVAWIGRRDGEIDAAFRAAWAQIATTIPAQ